MNIRYKTSLLLLVFYFVAFFLALSLEYVYTTIMLCQAIQKVEKLGLARGYEAVSSLLGLRGSLSQVTPIISRAYSIQPQSLASQSSLIFRQLFHEGTYTYTYLLACSKTGDAVLIDPVDDNVERDVKYAEELGLNVIYGINTHVHADHVTGTGKLKKALPALRSVISSKSGATADKHVENGNIITFGTEYLECRETPGHTGGCMTYVSHDHQMAFTGDALLIRGCGRTDFQQGNPSQLYDSVHKQILSLPDGYKLFPGHDYKGFSSTTVAEEKALNPRLTLSKEKFIQFMRELNLAYPKLIDISVPANLKCGDISKAAFEGTPEILDKIH